MLALRCAKALRQARAVRTAVRPRSSTVSRSRRERRDSVDASVLAERAAWAERLEASPPETAEEAARERDDEKRFKKAGLGVRRAGKRGVFRREGIEAARVGAVAPGR